MEEKASYPPKLFAFLIENIKCKKESKKEKYAAKKEN